MREQFVRDLVGYGSIVASLPALAVLFAMIALEERKWSRRYERRAT